ncbi:MAG: hypothetical protein MUF49_27965, partial [Oculatellaceae cyanobacterium Prado106]|nr:hypothetical protein [Oculatellaceae cyanobacterium Prado106]
IGNDTVYVGGGRDRLILDAGAGSVTVIGFSPLDQVSRGAGLKSTDALTLSLSGNDTLVNAGTDLLATLKDVRLER